MDLDRGVEGRWGDMDIGVEGQWVELDRRVDVGKGGLDKDDEGLQEGKGILNREGEGCRGLLDEDQGSEGGRGDVEADTTVKYCHWHMEAAIQAKT